MRQVALAGERCMERSKRLEGFLAGLIVRFNTLQKGNKA